jgi:hypothetical protein
MGKAGRPAVERKGQCYGLIRVLERRGSDKSGAACWLVRCEGELPDGTVCGVERIVAGRVLDDEPPHTHIGCRRAVNRLALVGDRDVKPPTRLP